MNMNDVGIIALVKKYPLLYDITSPLYLDQQKKDEAWNEIATMAGLSPYGCKTKWTRLRENYRKAIILRKKNGGKGNDRPVKYENEMSFLNKNLSANYMKKTQVEFAPEPQINVLPIENFRAETKGTKRPAEQKKHEINAFFDGIAETVKTLPKKIRVQLKRDIFNIVNDAEASVLNSDDDKPEDFPYIEPMVQVTSMQKNSHTSTNPYEELEDISVIKVKVEEDADYSTDIKEEIV